MWKRIFQSNFGEEIHYETKKIYRVVMSPYLLECFSQRIPDFFRPFLKILIQTLHIKKAEPFSAIKEFKFTLRFPGGCMQNVRLRHALEVNGFPTWCFGKESTCNAVDLGSIPGSGRSLGQGDGTHSRILAWGIPWAEEPGGLSSDMTE